MHLEAPFRELRRRGGLRLRGIVLHAVRRDHANVLRQGRLPRGQLAVSRTERLQHGGPGLLLLAGLRLAAQRVHARSGLSVLNVLCERAHRFHASAARRYGAGMTGTASPLREYVPGQIWLKEYPIHYAGTDFDARMTVVRLGDGRLWIHSPSTIDAETKEAIAALGPVAFIVAPGSYHYFHVPSWQQAFPDADTYICPGIERKRPDLHFDWILGDRAERAWDEDLDQVLVRGNRLIWETAFLHRASKTLILVDLIENIGDETPHTNWALKFWWKAVFHMWNNPKPAPEYQIGWKDKAAAKKSLERILEWDFERIVIAHGDLIEADAKAVARRAWRRALVVASWTIRNTAV